MEFLMETPQVPQIHWNYEDIKAAAVAKAAEYKGIIYKPEDEAAMKKDRADLNRVINAIEDERKRVKKVCMAPYEVFEAQVKDVLVPLREATTVISAGLADIEKNYRREKEKAMKAIFDETLGREGMGDLIPFSKTLKEEFYKKAYTAAKLDKAYREMCEGIASYVSEIRSTVDERYHAAAIQAYCENFDQDQAQAEVFRLQKLDQELEQRKKAEEERRAKLEEIRAEAEKATSPAPAPQAAEPQETAPRVAVTEPLADLQGIRADEPIVQFGPIICRGTKSQLLGLAAYIKEHGIECRKAVIEHGSAKQLD